MNPEEALRANFATRIKALRAEKGYPSPKAFAEAVGISYNAVYQWEIGRTLPTKGMTKHVASILGVPIETLAAVHPKFVPGQRDKSKGPK